MYLYRKENDDRLDVLFVGAHPDDVEILAGGTVAVLVRLGYRVGVVDLTRGEAGSRGTPELRRQESVEAAQVLDVALRYTPGCPDGELENTREARLEMVRFIRRHRPRQVYTHHPRDPHPDHTAAFLLTRAAVHNAGLGKVAPGSEPFRPHYLFAFAPPHRVEPSFLVDVSEAWETKCRAVRCHASQVAPRREGEAPTFLGQSRFFGLMEAHSLSLGALVGVKHAEAFHTFSCLVTDDPLRSFGRKTGRLL
ncbi:MAG: bacillithiol biosynthesis deacetylase BshB1 [Acidobacteria bacterium]|nr:bacillithiol biosynthesis deacetylase BshB1 [Acidobacteriota bacterium]